MSFKGFFDISPVGRRLGGLARGRTGRTVFHEKRILYREAREISPIGQISPIGGARFFQNVNVLFAMIGSGRTGPTCQTFRTGQTKSDGSDRSDEFRETGRTKSDLADGVGRVGGGFCGN